MPATDLTNPITTALGRAKAIVLDFDGTLVHSNAIKRAAFDRCFDEFPEHAEAIAAYCHAHHQVPRWEKFRHVYERVLQLPYTAELEARLCQQYETLTTQRIIQAPEVAGAGAWLASMTKRCALALLSSSPQASLETIVRAREWDRFVVIIRGAPVEKATWLREFRRERGLRADELLFVGDTLDDARAAREGGCPFLGVGPAVRADGVALAIDDFIGLMP